MNSNDPLSQIVFKKSEMDIAVPESLENARKGNTWIVAIFAAIIIIIFIVMISLISWAAVSRSQYINQQQQQQNLPNCTSSPATTPPVTIPSNSPQCFQNSNPTSMYYIGNLNDGIYDYVVAPWPTEIQDVCVKFCSNSFSDGICLGPNYAGKTAQENYDFCISQLTELNSGKCKGVYPLASKGTILYYAQSPTCLTCDFC